jgi:OFA family oxalate/formate antiporter-like MFS transporter
MSQETTNQGLPNRWLLAGGGVLMQLALGAVYAWSVFRIPLNKTFGWSISDVTWAFSLAILVLGFAAFIGGLWMRRVGPRIVGITAGTCYGLGVALSSFSSGDLLPDNGCTWSFHYEEPARRLEAGRLATFG